jgi:SAM-dependent methyltransferase
MALPPLTPYANLRWDVVRRHLPTDRSRVLEVGCGQGAVAVRLAQRHDYTGVEIDGASVELARRRMADAGLDGRFVHGRVEELDGEDGDGFDLVCAFEVLEHIEDDMAAATHWIDRLRPGGRLLLSVPAWQSRYGAMDQAVGHFRRYDPPVLKSVLERAGAEGVAMRQYGMPLGYALEAVRNQIASRRPGMRKEGSMADRTARSGRLFQPRTIVAGMGIRAGTYPFRLIQRAFPSRGTGLVAWAHRPSSA